MSLNRSQDVPCFSWNQNPHSCPVFRAATQCNPPDDKRLQLHNLPYHPPIYFYTYVCLGAPPFQHLTKILHYVLPHHTCYMPRLLHPPLHDYPNTEYPKIVARRLLLASKNNHGSFQFINQRMHIKFHIKHF